MRDACKLILVVVLALFEGGFIAAADPPEPLASARVHRLVDTTGLLLIEQAVLPPPLVAGPAAHENLPAYYAASNPRLRDRLEHIRQLYELGANRSCRAITLVAGDAGIGKTFLKKEVFREDYGPRNVLKCDIREQYEQWRQEGIVDLRPDLCCGDQVINSLLALCDPHDTPLLRLLNANSASFVVIDSIDELHPDDYVTTLQQIEQYVFSSGRDFAHVVVFGRPCAFIDYWATKTQRDSKRDIQLFSLSPPQLRTTGDLLVSSWNYCNWKFGAQHLLANGETAPLTFADFAGWSRADFARSGRFSNIVFKENREITPRVRDALLQLAQQQRIIGPALRNLAGNTILREIVADRVDRELPYNERQFMDDYFRAWLERDYQSDGRPSYEHPQHFDVYLQLLEQVAVRYVTEAKVDQQGFFAVGAQDQVRLMRDGQQLAFPVQRILDRSGLIHIDPANADSRRYRFEPIWMHRYLAQRCGERGTPLRGVLE